MNPEKLQRLQACLQEAASILYEETPASELQDHRKHRKSGTGALARVGWPPSRPFFIRQATGTDQGRERQVKSCVGVLPIREKQASQLGLKPRTQLSPLLEKCCLLVSANESYQDAEKDIEALTGVKRGTSTQHRLIQSQEFELPDAKQAVPEVSIDGGKVRLRGAKGEKSYWRDVPWVYACRASITVRFFKTTLA